MKKRRNKNKTQPQGEEPASPTPSTTSISKTAVERQEPEVVYPTEELDLAMPDDQEPTISRLTLPMLIVPLLALLIYFADMYLIDNSGKFSAMVYDPNENLPVPPGGPSLYELGRMVFDNKAKCVSCHQSDGMGNPAQNAPPLAGSDWVLAEGPNRLIRIVLNGLTGPVTVNGKPFNNTMLPWKDILTDEDIAGVLTFIRQNQGWGNKASAVTPEEVKAIRESTAKRPSNWTGPELLQIPEK